MRTVVSGDVHVSYGQIYVQSDAQVPGPGLSEAFAGQDAGLCGAAVPGALFLLTGLHTGRVAFTVELHGEEPSLDSSWEEIVDASFRPESLPARLVEWGGSTAWDIGLEETDYRVRYCATGIRRVTFRPRQSRYPS
jgi:hypothetical protein